MRVRRGEIERLASEQQHNPHLPHVLMPALAAALCGAVANIGLKGVGELVKGRSPMLHVTLCALLVAPAALIQINFINRGLFLYPQSVFLSVYGAVLVLANTVYGAFYFEEYRALLSSTPRFAFFSFGCMMIISGIWLFKLRQPMPEGDTVEEEKALLDMCSLTDAPNFNGAGPDCTAEMRPYARAGARTRAAGADDDL